MHTVILNGWPRIAVYRGEIIRGFVAGWRRVDEQSTSSSTLEEVTKRLEEGIKLLDAAVRATADDAASSTPLHPPDTRLIEREVDFRAEMEVVASAVGGSVGEMLRRAASRG